MNKRKIVLLAVALCMVAILGFGSTLAYLTDTDNKTNVFTVGNVKIEQNETDRYGKEFVDGQKLLPIVHDGKDELGYHTGKNYIDKIITVKNTGTEDAYVRTHIAFPAVLDDGANTYNASDNILHWNGASANDKFAAANTGSKGDNDWYWDANLTTDWPGNAGPWNSYETTIDGVPYTVYVATHKRAVVPGEETAPTLYGVYLDSAVDYNNESGKYVDQNGNEFSFPGSDVKILAVSEACQAAGFDDAAKALNEVFGTPSAATNPWNNYGKTVTE